ncbi:uncharacterized protein LOC6601051 [Drosophila persimilis]|nr:uncharacterized protein LOC6601051 [Drosophila persimilis]
MSDIMPEVVCCRCGALPHSLPYCIGGTGREYHCFCCLKPPPQKCIYCNAWRDIDLNMTHTGCVSGNFHVFICTEPWPPFPTEINNIPAARGHPPEHLMPLSFAEGVPSSTLDAEYNTGSFASEQEQTIVLDDEAEVPSDSEWDIKPQQKPLQEPSWYSVQQIKQWIHCIRCNKVRTSNAGWIKHAQKCAQDPQRKEKKFFIYNHIKGWCNYQVLDSRWDIHSGPKNGTCRICREAREIGVPLPYMPKQPLRPNERKLAAQRLRNRRMRKQRRMTRVYSPPRNPET